MANNAKSKDEIAKQRNFKNRFTDALAYVSFWIDREGIKVTAKQQIIGKKRRIIASSLLEKIELDYDVERRDEFGAGKSPNLSKLLGKALNQYMENVVFHALEDLKIKLAFDVQLDERIELRRFLKAITGLDDEINLSVMSHWLWMVKSNMHGMAVENHIMPIIHGPQGYGKSKAIMKLIAPLDEFVGLLDLDQMLDPKMIHSTKDLLINFIDEMRQADKVDVAALKNLITAPYRSGRRAFSPMADHLPNLTSLIGATNKDIQDIIRDDTGMRRFFVIDAPNRCDWDTINSCDYEAIWRSIDETSGGYTAKADMDITSPDADSLASRQSSYADAHPVLQWYRECDPKTSEGGAIEFVSDTLVLEEIVNFMERSGIKAYVSKNQATRKLTPFLGKKKEIKELGVSHYGWVLNEKRKKFKPLQLYARDKPSEHQS